jgi:polyhydroxyalkanoate synthase
VLTNPELLRETLNSNAENLARGMHMLAEDITAGGGDLKIRQSDAAKFEVGRNLATTPGKVILQNDLMQLIQYAPSTPTVLKTPLLIVPPWINKFYVLDLTPEKSFIKWCVDQGLTVFVISWINRTHASPTWGSRTTWRPACRPRRDRSGDGREKVHTIGTASAARCLLRSPIRLPGRPPHRIDTLFAAAWTSRMPAIEGVRRRGATRRIGKTDGGRGYLEGKKMANAFNLLRSNDLIWPYVINNYLRGKAPMPFDLLYWNSDATRMPAANHAFYLRQCYLNNALAMGKMQIGGVKLDLKKVKVPLYNLATREDHIAPAQSAFLGSRFFGGPVKFVLAGSGHIAGVVNPPSKGKYQYWTGGKAGTGTVEAWLEHATEHSGSWWPDWIEWIKAQDATEVPAREPGDGKLKPIEDAPGRYVKVRA